MLSCKPELYLSKWFCRVPRGHVVSQRVTSDSKCRPSPYMRSLPQSIYWRHDTSSRIPEAPRGRVRACRTFDAWALRKHPYALKMGGTSLPVQSFHLLV
jgi:hypothetical protein